MSRGEISVLQMEEGHRRDWSHYVSRHAAATFFHELCWLDAVEQAYGHRSRYLVAFDGRRVVGVLPVFQINSVLAGRIMVSVPYGTYGGILADDGAAAQALVTEAKRLAEAHHARSLELRSIHAADPTLSVERTHATFRGPLPAKAEEVGACLPRKARAAARRASEKHDLTVEFGGHLLRAVWRLYARSMRRLGSPNYPYAFFEALAANAPQGTIAQLVRCSGRPVAGLLTFRHRETVMPYFAGLDERSAIYGLSHYLYAESMRWGVQHGYEVYDFGRSRYDNSGSFEFKRLCGFAPQALGYQTYVTPGRAAPDLAPSSPRWAAARRVWKALPLPITRPLGAWLAKSIPG